MERLDYRPNRLAQSLVTSRTRTIGLLVSELTNSLYPPVILGAEAACRAAGYSLLLANASDAAAERRAIELMLDKRVDGLIHFSASLLAVDNAALARASATGIPVVAINRHLPPDMQVDQVHFDHRGGGRLATHHLIDLGHRRIAHLAGPADRFTGRDRRAGYDEALREAGIADDRRLVGEGDYSFECGYRLLHRIWHRRPTAVFVGGDVMVLGALRAAHELGLRVPADLALVAFGNPDCVRYATPGITTIDLPVVEAGRVAAELVLRRIAQSGPGAEREVRTLETTVLVRETTGPPA
jgi:LacI family transcriptional regulator